MQHIHQDDQSNMVTGPGREERDHADTSAGNRHREIMENTQQVKTMVTDDSVLSVEKFNAINRIKKSKPHTRLEKIVCLLQFQYMESWRINHCRPEELKLSADDWQYYMDNADKDVLWTHSNEPRKHFIYHGLPVIT